MKQTRSNTGGLLGIAALAMIMLSVFPLRAHAQVKAFSKTLNLQGIKFTVACPNSGSLNKLTITAKSKKVNAKVSKEAEGTVTGAEVEDLNSDGSPEIVVYVTSAGSGSYGTVIAFGAKGAGLTPIPFPELPKGSKELKGYMGHDQFAVVENSLVRRFPLYSAGDTNAKPTGKTRQIQYKLAGGKFVMSKSLDI